MGSVPDDIAQRVASTAAALPVGREQAQVAARDAGAYLQRIRVAAIDDAFRRYTHTNTPAYVAHQRAAHPTSRVPVIIWFLSVIGVLIVAGAMTGSVVWAMASAASVLVGLTGVQIALNSRTSSSYNRTDQARINTNPWPYQAERAPAWNPDAEPGATRVETRLLGLAVLISEEIRRSPAWNSPLLDQQRVRINLDATLQDISHRAYRVWKMRTDTPRPSGDSQVTPVLAQHLDEYTTAARMAEHALRDHVAALAEYLGELRPVERLMYDLNLLDRTSTGAHRDLLEQLYRDAVGNEHDARRMQQHSNDLRDLQASLDTQFHFLREQVSRTNLLR